MKNLQPATRASNIGVRRALSAYGKVVTGKLNVSRSKMKAKAPRHSKFSTYLEREGKKEILKRYITDKDLKKVEMSKQLQWKQCILR